MILSRSRSEAALLGVTLACVLTAVPISARASCGDGIVELGESCDDGNLVDDDGCRQDCTVSTNCTLYPAPGVPIPLPDVATTFSQINVTSSGQALEVEIVGLNGTHTYIGDLMFRLVPPSGLGVTVIGNLCSSNDNFNVSLDDDAISALSCPITDGQPHRPTSALSALDGEDIQGTWTLVIQDVAGLDSGTLNGWTLKLCAGVCGNGIMEGGEVCDDNNVIDGDGCDSTCRPTGCGSGAVSGGELCDDGNLADGDGCDSNCTPTACGNGIHSPNEQCEDGNTIDGDGCDSTCRFTGCGSGAVTGSEVCDDGNAIDGDGCDSNCTPTACGNGIQSADEECDDGNLIDNDGCDSQCRLPCPQSLCTCLGDAGPFTMVGTKADVKPGRQSVSGYAYQIPATVSGSICAVVGKFSGKLDGTTEISGDVVLSGPLGRKAVGSFKGFRSYGYSYPGVFVGGDLITGGGLISGAANVEVSGTTNTTGTHPLVGSCNAAILDAKAASDYFLGLPPGQSLPEVEVAAGAITTLMVGPGIQVISTPSINIKSKRYEGYPIGGTLEIALDPNTTVAVINVAEKIAIGNAGSIVVDGDPAAVVINVHGESDKAGKIKIGKGAVVDPPIVAPGAKATISPGAFTSNLLGPVKTGIKGAGVGDVLGCN
jgi:cysteine-rich repeat protein